MPAAPLNLDLRDWFAGRVMSAFDISMSGATPAELAMYAYRIADAMLAERAKFYDAEAKS